jgi:DNA-binding NtrC family response regulator
LDEISAAFRRYSWAGHVRELRNVIERALILEDGDMITTEYLPRGIASEPATRVVGSGACRLQQAIPAEANLWCRVVKDWLILRGYRVFAEFINSRNYSARPLTVFIKTL